MDCGTGRIRVGAWACAESGGSIRVLVGRCWQDCVGLSGRVLRGCIRLGVCLRSGLGLLVAWLYKVWGFEACAVWLYKVTAFAARDL